MTEVGKIEIDMEEYQRLKSKHQARLEYRKQYNKMNPQMRQKENKKYYEKNKEKLREKARERAKINYQKMKAMEQQLKQLEDSKKQE